MTQIATVEKILPGGMAEISVPRKSACGHDCEECAGCGVSGASVRAVARNDARAEVGQKVVVESSTKNLLGVMLLVYLLPIVLFLVGYFATGALESEGLRYAVAIAAFLVVPCYPALRRAGAGMRELPLRGASVQGTVRHGAHRRARNGGRPQSGARLVAASRPY